MDGIHPFTGEHLEQVVSLFRESFFGVARRDPNEVTRKFREKFLESPCNDERFPSLVHVEDDGRLTGFIGVLPQRFQLDGRELNGVLLAELMVAERCSLGMAGYHITKHAMGLGQDFSITNRAGPAVDAMWKRLKSVPVWPYCVQWRLELKPARLTHQRLLRRAQGKRRIARPVLRASAPLFALADDLPQRKQRRSEEPPRGSTEPLDAAGLIQALEGLDKKGRLRLASIPENLQWTLDYLSDYPERGEFVARVVRDKRGKAKGWYGFFCGPNGWHEVVTLHADAAWWPDVVQHLRRDSEAHGGARLFGEVSAKDMDALLDAGAVIEPRKWGFCVNSSDAAIIDAFRTGEALMTGLETEMSI